MHEIKTETLVQAIGEKMKKKEPLGDSDAVEESIIAGLAGTVRSLCVCSFVRLFVRPIFRSFISFLAAEPFFSFSENSSKTILHFRIELGGVHRADRHANEEDQDSH